MDDDSRIASGINMPGPGGSDIRLRDVRAKRLQMTQMTQMAYHARMQGLFLMPSTGRRRCTYLRQFGERWPGNPRAIGGRQFDRSCESEWMHVNLFWKRCNVCGQRGFAGPPRAVKRWFCTEWS